MVAVPIPSGSIGSTWTAPSSIPSTVNRTVNGPELAPSPRLVIWALISMVSVSSGSNRLGSSSPTIV